MAKDRYKRAEDRYNTGKKDTLHVILLFPVIILALWFIFTYVAGFARVNGVSMQETIKNGEIVIMNRMQKDIERGEIVDVLLPSGEFYIKRVVAVAGDTVDIEGGILYVNGVPEEGYVFYGETSPENGSVVYPYTVSENCVFVVGDNREESVDSRAFGAVNLHGVKGVIKYRCGWLYLHKVQ